MKKDRLHINVQKKLEKKLEKEIKRKIKIQKEDSIISSDFSYQSIKKNDLNFKKDHQKNIISKFKEETSIINLSPILLITKTREFSPNLIEFFEEDLDSNINEIRNLFKHLENIYKKFFNQELKCKIKSMCSKFDI